MPVANRPESMGTLSCAIIAPSEGGLRLMEEGTGRRRTAPNIAPGQPGRQALRVRRTRASKSDKGSQKVVRKLDVRRAGSAILGSSSTVEVPDDGTDDHISRRRGARHMSAADVRHLVVLVLENQSFDRLLGY